MEPETAPALPLSLSGTRRTLAAWSERPLPVVGSWFAGAVLAALALLAGTLVVAELTPGTRDIDLLVPPVSDGGAHYVLTILGHNLLVLALHAMICVAGFIAGARMPTQAQRLTGSRQTVHLRAARLAIGFVIAATAFSLCNQIWDLGTSAAGVAHELGVSRGLLLVALLPHALPELIALFLPLAAWVIASRRNRWDELLAAALVTTAIAVPILVGAAMWESFGAPHMILWITGR